IGLNRFHNKNLGKQGKIYLHSDGTPLCSWSSSSADAWQKTYHASTHSDGEAGCLSARSRFGIYGTGIEGRKLNSPSRRPRILLQTKGSCYDHSQLEANKED